MDAAVNPMDVERTPDVTTPVRTWLHRWRVRLRDARHNRRCARAGPRILVLRHPRNNWSYNHHFLAWLERRVPAAAARLELGRLPGRRGGWERYALVVPWIQDPIRERFPEVYATLRAIEESGIATVNRAAETSHAIKSVAGPLMGAAGVRVARTLRIADPARFVRAPDGLAPPFIVREDERHGCRTFLVERLEQLGAVPFAEIAAPVAVEFVDTRGADGLYRKYRYVAFGARGYPRHLMVAAGWHVGQDARVFTDAIRREERAFLERPDPNHAVLQRVRVALGLDVVAFDYAYDRAGTLVVFEPNPFPNHWHDSGDAGHMAYQHRLIEVVYRAYADYLLARAGLADPALLEDASLPVL